MLFFKDLFCLRQEIASSNQEKHVNGNIPVCSDCAMLVIQEQLQSHKLAEKIDIEAQEFSLTNENEPESIPDSIKKHAHQIASREDDQIIYKIIITAAIFLILVIIVEAINQS